MREPARNEIAHDVGCVLFQFAQASPVIFRCFAYPLPWRQRNAPNKSPERRPGLQLPDPNHLRLLTRVIFLTRRLLSALHSLQTTLRFPPFRKFQDAPIDRALRIPARESVESLASYAHCASRQSTSTRLTESRGLTTNQHERARMKEMSVVL